MIIYNCIYTYETVMKDFVWSNTGVVLWETGINLLSVTVGLEGICTRLGLEPEILSSHFMQFFQGPLKNYFETLLTSLSKIGMILDIAIILQLIPA